MFFLTKFKNFILSGVAVILLASVFVVFYKMDAFKENKINLFKKANHVAIGTIDPAVFDRLSAEASDLNLPEYARVRNQLSNLKEAYDTDGIYGFYLMKMSGQDIKFYADSARVDDPWHSEPGVVYTEPSQPFFESFAGTESFFGPYTDEYGSFYSLLSPIRNAQGEVIAVLGIDIISSYFDKLISGYLYYQLFMVFVVLLIYILLFYLVLRYFQVNFISQEKVKLNQEVDLKIQEALKLKNEAEIKSIELDNTKKAILNILEDVQGEKEKVEKITQRLELATMSAKIGVWEWDLEKNKMLWDDQMYRLYGRDKAEGVDVFKIRNDAVHPDDKKLREQAIEKALKENINVDITFRVIWPSGEVKYLKTFALVEKDAQGKPIKMVGVNFDVTHEKEVDMEKTEFVSLASHQLKTPVGAIRWTLEMLLAGDYGRVSAKQKEVLAEAYTMNTRMNDLINDLLNISRIEMGVFIIEPKPTDFVNLCEEVIREMEPRRLEKGHEIKTNFEKDLSEIPADPTLLRIIFQNLISNAIRYTTNKIWISLEKKEGQVVFSVANNGPCILEKDQPKIFQKMFRTKDAQERVADGNGLGLYLAKKITESAGGQISFISKKGENTVFLVSFPLSGMVAKKGTKQLS